MTGHHPHDLLWGILLLSGFVVLLALMFWDIGRQCEKAQHEDELDELWDDDPTARCECGATEIAVLPGTVVANLVCPRCPSVSAPERRTFLRLVRNDDEVMAS